MLPGLSGGRFARRSGGPGCRSTTVGMRYLPVGSTMPAPYRDRVLPSLEASQAGRVLQAKCWGAPSGAPVALPGGLVACGWLSAPGRHAEAVRWRFPGGRGAPMFRRVPRGWPEHHRKRRPPKCGAGCTSVGVIVAACEEVSSFPRGGGQVRSQQLASRPSRHRRQSWCAGPPFRVGRDDDSDEVAGSTASIPRWSSHTARPAHCP